MTENCSQDLLRSELQVVKVIRFLEKQRGFYKCTAGGQNKISFSNFTALFARKKWREKFSKLRNSFRQMEATQLRLELLLRDPAKGPPNLFRDC